GNLTRLEAARELGLWLLAQLPRGSEIAVLDSRHGVEAFQVDRGAAKHRIENLSTLAATRPLMSTLDEAARLLGQSELERKEIHVFTDMARVSWPREPAGRLLDRLAHLPELGLFVVDVGVEEPVNSALGELRLSSQVLSDRSPLGLQTELSHSGAGGERTVELYLLEPERSRPGQGGLVPQKRDQQTVGVDAGQSREISLSVDVLNVGTHQGYVEIVGEDGLACDDRRFFTVEVKPAWKILVAAPEPAASSASLLTEALAPSEFRRSGKARFQCDVIEPAELEKHALPGPYSAVMLIDPDPLKPDVWQKLADFASEGRGVAVFLGRRATQLESFNASAAQEVLAGKLLRQARSPEDDHAYLAPQNYQHPILGEFRGIEDSVPWVETPVYRFWQLERPDDGVQVVVPFNDGQPAVLEKPLARGRAITITTPVCHEPVRQAWNLFLVNNWPFYVLVNEMALYLVGSGDQQLNYYAGQTAVLQLDPERAFRSYVLTALDASDEVKLRLTPDLQKNVLAASTENVGNYRVRAGGVKSGVDRGFSVNLDPEETRLDRISDDELAEIFGELSYRVARNRHELEGDRSMRRVGRELFGLLIFLVALALSFEHFVANRFYRE
ncbi:MAG: vWA domain-containing protein, partial [Planctomycetota bacterium]